ncbi:hypothetical protein [Actinomadura macra]|uniref:hypothetical protein n=1 Tax=Actinomadura macra TaxID=46164 RepID=UPI001C3F3CC5|nr:hypothetical protein [Actinomadura macra]
MISAIPGALVTIAEELDRIFPKVSKAGKPIEISLFTFADAVRSFSRDHPGDPSITAGALLRRPHPGGHLIFQVFLDRKDQIVVQGDGRPHGKAIVARSLDDELAGKFTNSDLVIFR